MFKNVTITLQNVPKMRPFSLISLKIVDSRPRELSPYYWPLPLRVVQTTTLFPQFPPR